MPFHSKNLMILFLLTFVGNIHQTCLQVGRKHLGENKLKNMFLQGSSYSVLINAEICVAL